jgi:hypothetical protein
MEVQRENSPKEKGRRWGPAAPRIGEMFGGMMTVI